jgi:hypothetical protein
MQFVNCVRVVVGVVVLAEFVHRSLSEAPPISHACADVRALVGTLRAVREYEAEVEARVAPIEDLYAMLARYVDNFHQELRGIV